MPNNLEYVAGIEAFGTYWASTIECDDIDGVSDEESNEEKVDAYVNIIQGNGTVKHSPIFAGYLKEIYGFLNFKE